MRMLGWRAIVLFGLLWAGVAAPATAEHIAIIGTGEVGTVLGKKWAAKGHKIVYGSRTPDADKVKQVVKDTGHGATATTPEKAAAAAEMVLLAVPSPSAKDVVPKLGNLAGKIVMDPMNYFIPVDNYPGPLQGPSLAQQVQAWLPGAKVVKAFNTFAMKMIEDPKLAGGPITVPIAGDDVGAKERVGKLAADAGLEFLDVGPLTAATFVEGMEQLYLGYRMYNRGKGKGFEFHLRPVPDTVFPVAK
jgi:predicted dinucleotide-binding enzyme